MTGCKVISNLQSASCASSATSGSFGRANHSPTYRTFSIFLWHLDHWCIVI